MSSSTNITESLNKFGVGESDTEILIVGVDNSLEDVKENLSGWDEWNEWIGMERLTKTAYYDCYTVAIYSEGL